MKKSEDKKGKTILVTGSTGMIGKKIVAHLKEKKYSVKEFSFDKGNDVTNAEHVMNAAKGVDYIIHLAAIIDETAGENELFRVNVGGTKNVLDAAEKNNIEQFIFLSSVGIYGNTKETFSEESPLHPVTPYEKSKAAAEQDVWDRQEVFSVTVIRPAMVIGPNPYWKSIFKTVGKGFPLIGKGKNPWQLVDVDDLAEFVTMCVGNEDTYNESYIVAGEEAPPLRQLVDWIADVQGKKHVGSIPKSLGMTIGYVFGFYGKITGKKPLLIPEHVKRLFKHRSYSIKKALSTGWKPRFSTKESLEKTYHELFEKK